MFKWPLTVHPLVKHDSQKPPHDVISEQTANKWVKVESPQMVWHSLGLFTFTFRIH